jgi:putative RNA 2'-phosphotransferase
MNLKSISRAITKALRHTPEMYTLAIDKSGYVSVEALIKAIGITMIQLEEIVDTSDKKRLAFNEDKTLIRATNGHSIKGIDVGAILVEPMKPLYHGTYINNIEFIEKQGLKKMGRVALHLSDNSTDAIAVGRRGGAPILYEVNTMDMIADGYKFYQTENGVYYTDHVPPQYLKRV